MATMGEPFMDGCFSGYKALLDGFEEQIALIDASGKILVVNVAWELFAKENGLADTPDWAEQNYLEVCQSSAFAGDSYAAEVLLGIRQVLSGLDPYYIAEYPCHSPAIRRWFRLRIAPLGIPDKTLFLVTHLNITARYLAEERALLDPLTSLPNRRKLDDFLFHEWQRAIRTKSPVSCIMLDIDHFKQFNDSEGHLKGDQCLREIADTLHLFVRRPSDIVSRFGGEEFLMILGDTQLKDAVAIAENLRKAIMALALKTTSASRTLLTISLGVSCFFPKRGQTENLLIDAADKALYKAKYAGRNRVEVMTLADSERSVTRPLLDQA
jgi:diguanylate cyclase (GGDEF)-like protein